MATRLTWIIEGLRAGVVASHYPKRADSEATFGVRTRPTLMTERCQANAGCDKCVHACLPNAITIEPVERAPEGGTARVTLDSGRCIGCALCVAACPYDALVMTTNGAPAARTERALRLVERVGQYKEGAHE